MEISNLLDKVNIVDYISQFAELEKRGNEYWCNSPLNKSDDNPSFSVDENKQIFYCFSTGKGGNILNFIMEYYHINFKSALEKLCKYLNYDINNIPKTPSLIRIAKKFNYDNQEKFFIPIKFKNDVMEQYIKEPIKEWLDEGISQQSLDKYQVRYDKKDNRIVFPIWNNEGNIIAISGRTLYEDFKERNKTLPPNKKIRKYTYYGDIGTTYFFYGFWQNQKYIYEKNEILIFEGAKSVMKSEDYGFYNAVASMTDKLSPEQIKSLIKINVKNIIICWDKGITLKDIKEKLGILTKFKNVYVVIDTFNLLKDKESPVDKDKDIWIKLYENRIRIK